MVHMRFNYEIQTVNTPGQDFLFLPDLLQFSNNIIKLYLLNSLQKNGFI